MSDEERRNLYMQNPFDILTKEKLDRLERHCKKAIHYERGHIQEEHQVTLELIYKYQEQQAEIEKKDKIIDEMGNHIATSDNNLCQYLDMTTKCKYYAGENKKTCDNCIKEYFKKKAEDK